MKCVMKYNERLNFSKEDIYRDRQLCGNLIICCECVLLYAILTATFIMKVIVDKLCVVYFKFEFFHFSSKLSTHGRLWNGIFVIKLHAGEFHGKLCIPESLIFHLSPFYPCIKNRFISLVKFTNFPPLYFIILPNARLFIPDKFPWLTSFELHRWKWKLRAPIYYVKYK